MVRKDGSELGFMCEKGEKEDEKRELLVYSKSEQWVLHMQLYSMVLTMNFF